MDRALPAGAGGAAFSRRQWSRLFQGITPTWLRTRLPRRITAPARCRPDFLIIGGQRCGTTSLFRYLLHHPLIMSPSTKELHFFDLQYPRGLSLYRSYFPLSARRYLHLSRPGARRLTGEATPYYLFHPLAPTRIAETLPAVRLIALLRDPVHRAYSHYQLELRLGAETLEFEDALDLEDRRLAGEEERLRASPAYYSHNHQHFAYVRRGIYANQVQRVFDVVPKERALILESEALFLDPGAALDQVAEFLDIPSWRPPMFERFHRADYQPMRAETEGRLREFFRPHNDRLCHLLQRSFSWA